VISITFATVPQISSCAIIQISGQQICITLTHKVKYIEFEHKSHTDLWFLMRITFSFEFKRNYDLLKVLRLFLDPIQER
jgi:hypothetical protein